MLNSPPSRLPTPDSINDKNLDYEIETCHCPNSNRPMHSPINDKNLDYEIETNKNFEQVVDHQAGFDQ